MANTHPRCYPPGVNTGVPAAYDRTAANNNSIIVNKSTIIRQEESIQAQATSVNQNCCNELPNIKSLLDVDSMPFHGGEVLNNVRKNVLFSMDQEIGKWDIEMYTLICKLGQLSNNLPALAKIIIIFVDYAMWTMKFQQHKLQWQPTWTIRMN
jgi:hypothetical protein